MFEKKFGVPYYGLGPDERVKPGLILQFFQEAAALHADSLKIGVEDLLRDNVTWVLRRYRVRVHRYPRLGDLAVRTWFEPVRNLTSVRVFELIDAAGEIVANGWSGWIVVDLERGRPVRLDRALNDEYFAATEPTGEPVTDKLTAVGDDSAPFDLSRDFRVRWSELDLNGHTNHTVYFDWALETVPDELTATHRPVGFDAEYLHSAMREDVQSLAKKISDAPLTYAHTIRIAKSGAEAARIETIWAKNEP
ncbi:hypothetical protein LJC31_08240 [Synergistaceae bacterium OttesenSCG-928-I11]|nr:hypothetical protein [Synergistaceae bacterium OttesenSCG-928-I11]